MKKKLEECNVFLNIIFIAFVEKNDLEVDIKPVKPVPFIKLYIILVPSCICQWDLMYCSDFSCN